jgi:amino acid transporter
MSPGYKSSLKPLTLTAIIFFTVSGGPYGLEPLLKNVSAPLAIALLVITPLLWSVPAILMVLELNSMMPKEGGYYWWVKEALGRKWGFFEGWWSWLFTVVDLAIYPVLFVQYLTYFFPGVDALQIPLCLGIIWVCTLLNLLGVLTVGRSSVILGAAVLLPFGVLFVSLFSTHSPGIPTGQSLLPSNGIVGLAMGLFTVMWNYLGWDNSSTVAEEVQKPVKSYLIGMGVAFTLIVLGYVFSTLAATTTGIDPTVLESEGFPSLGMLVGGWWLGAFIALGGMASALGLFLSILCAVSRLPKVMADDQLLPELFGRMTRRTAVPHISIITCSLIVSGMILWGFSNLLIIDVTLYGSALMLEFISLAVMRVKRPDAERPFRIPLTTPGILVLIALPALCILVAVFAILSSTNIHTGAALFAIGAVATGPVAWFFARKNPAPVEVEERRTGT